ncbi:MAG: hypothetical protein ACYC7M_07455, partial [Bellilinea sp.]
KGHAASPISRVVRNCAVELYRSQPVKALKVAAEKLIDIYECQPDDFAKPCLASRVSTRQIDGVLKTFENA